MKKIFLGAFATALANCLAGHVVDCMFERLNLGCPRKGFQ